MILFDFIDFNLQNDLTNFKNSNKVFPQAIIFLSWQPYNAVRNHIYFVNESPRVYLRQSCGYLHIQSFQRFLCINISSPACLAPFEFVVLLDLLLLKLMGEREFYCFLHALAPSH